MNGLHYDRRVTAYHGTSREVEQALLNGGEFRRSENEHDWLGHGIYFWEDGLDRARQWATLKYGDEGAVVGALLQLGRCYDLMDTKFTRDLSSGAAAIHEMWSLTNAKIPINKRGHRALDCAVVNLWLEQLEGEGQSFQTVRRGFEEGAPVHDGMLITMESHIQIAVRDPSCILGVFRPR